MFYSVTVLKINLSSTICSSYIISSLLHNSFFFFFVDIPPLNWLITLTLPFHSWRPRWFNLFEGILLHHFPNLLLIKFTSVRRTEWLEIYDRLCYIIFLGIGYFEGVVKRSSVLMYTNKPCLVFGIFLSSDST